MFKNKTLTVIVIVGILLVVLLAGFLLTRGDGGSGSPTAIPAGTGTVYATTSTEPANQTQTSSSTVAGIEDVTYVPASDRYPEMDITAEGVTCNFGNTDEVTFTVTTEGNLHITSSKSHEDFTISPAQLAQVDNPPGGDGDSWVKLTGAGNVSVGFIDEAWKADWLNYCGNDRRTPAPITPFPTIGP